MNYFSLWAYQPLLYSSLFHINMDLDEYIFNIIYLETKNRHISIIF